MPDVWTVDVELPTVWQGTKKEVDSQALGLGQRLGCFSRLKPAFGSRNVQILLVENCVNEYVQTHGFCFSKSVFFAQEVGVSSQLHSFKTATTRC